MTLYMTNVFFFSDNRTYVSFSVVDDVLSVEEVQNVLQDRQSVLAELNFDIINLSQGMCMVTNTHGYRCMRSHVLMLMFCAVGKLKVKCK